MFRLLIKVDYACPTSYETYNTLSPMRKDTKKPKYQRLDANPFNPKMCGINETNMARRSSGKPVCIRGA